MSLRISGNFTAQRLMMQVPTKLETEKSATERAKPQDLLAVNDDPGEFIPGGTTQIKDNSNRKVTVNGETLSIGTKSDWEALGISQEMLDAFFASKGTGDDAKYSLKSQYTSLTATGSGGSMNPFTKESSSWKSYTLGMENLPDGTKHTKEVKVHSDGTIETVDKQVTVYEKQPKKGAFASFSKDDLSNLGITEEMMEKYFHCTYGSYALKSPYTSFEVTKLSGDTNHTGEIVFKRGDRTAAADKYQIKDGQAASSADGAQNVQNLVPDTLQMNNKKWKK